VIDIVYFARISWSEAWTLSFLQREKIAKKVTKYMKAKYGSKEKQILGE
jgi:hypothetical protein